MLEIIVVAVIIAYYLIDLTCTKRRKRRQQQLLQQLQLPRHWMIGSAAACAPPLLALCCSFLEQQERSRFARVCRAWFVATASPLSWSPVVSVYGSRPPVELLDVIRQARHIHTVVVRLSKSTDLSLESMEDDVRGGYHYFNLPDAWDSGLPAERTFRLVLSRGRATQLNHTQYATDRFHAIEFAQGSYCRVNVYRKVVRVHELDHIPCPRLRSLIITEGPVWWPECPFAVMWLRNLRNLREFSCGQPVTGGKVVLAEG